MSELFNWGSNDSESRRLRERQEYEMMVEQAINSGRTTNPAIAGGGGGINSPAFVGFVLDGPVSGATVTDIDSGKTTITDNTGRFKFATAPTGKIEATGGIDTITGVEYSGTLVTPEGGSIISPITTVMSRLIDLGSPEDKAAKLILASLKSNDFPIIPEESAAYTLLNTNYITESLDNENDIAVTVQAYSNLLEGRSDLATNALIADDLGGIPSSPQYKSKYKENKNAVWDSIATRISLEKDWASQDIIRDVDETISESIRGAINQVDAGATKRLLSIASQQALNTNYQTVSISSYNKSVKSYKDKIIELANPESAVDTGNLTSCSEFIEAAVIGERMEDNKTTLGRVDKDKDNVTEETYGGTDIKKTSAYWVPDAGEFDEKVKALGPQTVYAKDFKIGLSVFTSIEVQNLSGITVENYRYKWPTEDAQVHNLLAGDNIYEVSSLISEDPKEFEKEKQAYISNIYTVADFLSDNGLVAIEVPEPEKIKLEDPRYGIPDRASQVPTGDWKTAQDLNGRELIFDPNAPVLEVTPTLPGGDRTEQVKYKDVSDQIKLVEVIERVDSVVVKEEIIIRNEATDKELKSNVLDSNEKILEVESDKKNVISTEKIAYASASADKGGEFISTKAKAESNYLEE